MGAGVYGCVWRGEGKRTDSKLMSGAQTAAPRLKLVRKTTLHLGMDPASCEEMIEVIERVIHDEVHHGGSRRIDPAWPS